MEGDAIEDTAPVEMVDEGLQAWYVWQLCESSQVDHNPTCPSKLQEISVNEQTYGNNTESLGRANSGALEVQEG